ncbi:tyrosine-protein phosphatase [Mesorhizobium sp. L2C066B000]|uniref:tyrosine-protein phosphatase n=1 Tax=Mesorhizobium sp. L2C066B000 TaxID=1287105 RepID=UPI00067ED901|nr:tyrosine-protein phosphatase [Mesorhizobium sp. L2C066B000]
MKAANELGIRHIDFPMNARTELTQQQSLALIALLQSAPKPVLIHSKEGADRTGLAAALYLAALARANEPVSEAQLSVRYSHIGIPLVGPYEMDQSFEAMESLLGFFGS